MTLRHFLEIDDLSIDELTDVLDRSEKPQPPVLRGKGVALIFEKPSLRTRNSTEMAVVQLGGHPAYIQDNEITLDQRERTEDAIQVLQGYYDIICARVFAHEQLERMASVACVPVINLLSDRGHPCQALADLLTVRQTFGDLAGRRLAWIGDFSNVAMSFGIGFVMLGGSVVYSCPGGYGPSEIALDRLRARCGPGSFVETSLRPSEAIVGADVVSTDAWYSMGQEAERDVRRRAFEGFCVDSTLMSRALETAIFLHCLPAHRGEEATSEVLDGPQSRIFPQAHNRMHTMRGLFSWLDGQGAIR
jgi:ornithine carbamoyltransferase